MSQEPAGGSKPTAALSAADAVPGSSAPDPTAVAANPAAAHPAASAHTHARDHMAKLTLGSIGVVYGDIGTSPLYALKTALQHGGTASVSQSEVIGIISLLIWALLITVTAKYVLFLMRADNKGEGGNAVADGAGPACDRQARRSRVPARRHGSGAVLGRRHHHAGHLGSLGGRRARRRPGEPRSLHSPHHGRDPHRAVLGPALRHRQGGDLLRPCDGGVLQPDRPLGCDPYLRCAGGF